jgi:hypothetical protein
LKYFEISEDGVNVNVRKKEEKKKRKKQGKIM